ncbi:hypothetical protein BKA65DRAFT_560025 [Rhexocercosporidium sp. MPI-PUGE-AT-0058]|nr:hypothetical protein BKA65DRAFT_560025 [Rhexocercosporidium sp. MPI-PUGE-AT-0058]
MPLLNILAQKLTDKLLKPNTNTDTHAPSNHGSGSNGSGSGSGSGPYKKESITEKIIAAAKPTVVGLLSGKGRDGKEGAGGQHSGHGAGYSGGGYGGGYSGGGHVGGGHGSGSNADYYGVPLLHGGGCTV